MSLGIAYRSPEFPTRYTRPVRLSGETDPAESPTFPGPGEAGSLDPQDVCRNVENCAVPRFI